MLDDFEIPTERKNEFECDVLMIRLIALTKSDSVKELALLEGKSLLRRQL